jgi:hypothetical protein
MLIVGATGPAFTVRLKFFSEYKLFDPVSRILKLNVPATLGTPPITAPLKPMPVGRLPDTKDHV